jgi:hypothetical protein
MIALRQRTSLWYLFGGPVIWAVHFLAVYIAASVFCAKFAAVGEFQFVQLFVGAATVAALAAIAYAALHGLAYWRSALNAEQSAHEDTDEDRRRFLAHATLLLCGLSAIAVIYGTLPVLFIGSCW